VLFSLTRLSKLFAFLGKGVCLYKYLKNTYGSDNIFYSYWFNGAVFGCYLYNKHLHPIKFYTRVHGSDLYLEVNKDYLPLRPSVLKKITKVFSISENGKKYLEDKYALDANKVACSRLGTKDNKIYTRMTESQKEFSVVSCSHISPLKRIDMLLEALFLVAKDNTEMSIVWTHIGTGDQYADLKERSSQISVKNLKVRLLGDLSNKDVMHYYKTHAIDLFVNVSSSEGIPVTIMEAFSCSIPALAINNGGVYEIVNNENGVLLKKDSSLEEIASSISNCVRGKETLYKKKPMARNMWEKSYNADINYTNFCKELTKHD
jgi:glycosyltransferase involved in cell wall biosynthesis